MKFGMSIKSKVRHQYYRFKKYYLNPVYRRNLDEKKNDLRKLKKTIGAWGKKPIPHVDEHKMFGIVSFTDLPLHAKFHGIVAKTMELKGYTPFIFTFGRTIYARQCYELFGVKHLLNWQGFVEEQGISTSEIDRIVQKLLPDDLSVHDVMHINFKGVEIGKHALSMTCRKRVEGKLDLSDYETANLLRSEFSRGIEAILAADALFDQYPIKKLLVRDSGYIPNGPIYEVALRRNIDCIVLEFGQRKSSWVFKRYSAESKSRHYFSLAKETWEDLKSSAWTEELDQKLEKEFAARYEPKSEDDTRRLQAGKVIKSKSEVQDQLGLDPEKKTVIVFSHVAWDAAFFYGEGLFSDFEEWLYETVKYAKEHGSKLNWLIKIHPFNVFKLQRETVDSTSEMRLLTPLLPLPKNIKILHPDTDINTRSLFDIANCILTVNGTVGMEFPCFGIPAVVAGTGRYEGLGFTIEPDSKEAYFKTLETLDTIEPLDDSTRKLARKHFYYLMRGRQIMFNDIAPMELLKVHEAQNDLHDNIHLTSSSLEDFRTAKSISMLGDWLADSRMADIIDWRQI